MLPANRRVENAWMTLEQRGAPPAELLSADIYDSWMRCISFGLDSLRPPLPELVSPAILRQEQQRCSLVRGLALAERVPTGIVHVNDQTVNDEANVPFGGVRASGNGSRFGGATANVEAFTETRWVTVRADVPGYPF